MTADAIAELNSFHEEPKKNMLHIKMKRRKNLNKCIPIPICTTNLLISQDAKDSAEDAGKKAPEVDAGEALDNGGQDNQVISKSDGPLTPNATKVFNIIMKEAGQIKCVVNMRTKECSCRKWELTGIPCNHALAAIWDMAGNVEETAILESYCQQVHWLSTWKDMYMFKVNPCNGHAFWEKSTISNTIVPLKIHPQIGRPPKKRKKSAVELVEGMVKGN
nr:hypothetical protein [Tanacetum cinerariifolium]